METAIRNFPPSLSPPFMGAGIPVEGSGYKYGNLAFFNTYRNESISRMKSLSYDWGDVNIEYIPRPTASTSKADKLLRLPQSKISMLDAGRQQEVDHFYMACQMHRDQYKDFSGRLHPLDYFKKKEVYYQCPPDPTSVYLKYPERYVQYKSPQVLPLTTERSCRAPTLPDRALTGVYNPTSDIVYKR